MVGVAIADTVTVEEEEDGEATEEEEGDTMEDGEAGEVRAMVIFMNNTNYEGNWKLLVICLTRKSFDESSAMWKSVTAHNKRKRVKLYQQRKHIHI